MIVCICSKLAAEPPNGATISGDEDMDDHENDSESIHSGSALNMGNGRHFERPMNECNLLPDWLDDNDLKNSTTETLSQQEEEFWIDLIDKYLQPIEPTEEEKVEHNAYSEASYFISLPVKYFCSF